MSKSKTDSPQDGAMPDRAKAREHITKAESFCQTAEFDEALKEIGKARKICPGLENINQVEAEIKATAEKYKAEISAVREALGRKEFSEASSACERASELCPQAEITKSLEHKIKLEQAVQSGSERHEQAERGRRRKSAVIKTIGVGALVVVVVAVLFVGVSYLKDISWKSKKEHQVVVPKIPVKAESKKQDLKLEGEKQEVKAKGQKKFYDIMAEGVNYEAEKDWENAVKTYKKALSIKPDSKKAQDSFVNLCLAKAKANDNKRSAKIALKALEELLSVNPNHDEAKQLYNEISAYCAPKEPLWWLSKAKAELLTANTAFESNSMYCRIVKLQLKLGDISGAEDTVLKIESDSKERKDAYLAIIEAKATKNDIYGAKAAVSKISYYYGFPRCDAYKLIATAQAENGDNLGSKKTFEQAKAEISKKEIGGSSRIRLKTNKISAYCDIASAQIKVHDKYGAKETIAQAENLADSINEMEMYNGRYKAIAYIAIAEVKLGLGVIADMQDTLRKADNAAGNHTSLILERGILEKANAYYSIADIYTLASNKTKALEFLRKAAMTLNSLKSNFRNPVLDWRDKAAGTYVEITKKQANIGDYTEAEATAGYISNIPRYSTFKDDMARICIVTAQANAGDIATAKKTALKIKVRSCKSEAYLYIAKIQAQRGDFHGAFKTANKINDDFYGYKPQAYVAIGLEQWKAGKKETARNTLMQARKMVPNLKNGQSQVICYSQIAYTEAKFGEKKLATEIFKKALAIKGTYPYILYKQVDAEQYTEAKDTLTKISDTNYRKQACEVIAKAYTKANNLYELLQWTESLENEIERAQAYIGAAAGLIGDETLR